MSTSPASYSNSYNDLLPTFADLPMEIIIHIFRYLNFFDIQMASMTCTRWQEASEYFEFQKNKVVKISKTCISDKLTPGTIFMKSKSPLQNLYLDETVFGTMDMFFFKIGQKLKTITFDYVDLTGKQFCGIIRDLKHLNELTITNCSSLFMAGQFLESSVDRESICHAMANIKSLSLKSNQYLSDAILLRLTSLIFELENLDMSECHIAYHSAIQRRFYPEELANSPSESILTFKFLLQIIKMHAKTLKSINLSKTLIGGPGLSALASVNDLKLKNVELSFCCQININGIESLAKNQSMICSLDISGCHGVNDSCIDLIAENLIHLRSLNVSSCSKITNHSGIQISRINTLEIVNISQCCGITSDGILEGFGSKANCTLKELYMTHLDICEQCVINCVENLKNLRTLDISQCTNAVTDTAVQAIIKNLSFLRSLSLENCILITDAAITGINLQSQTGSPNNSNQSIEYLNRGSPVNNRRISLRSRAEEEIVQDAERKKAMIAVYELNSICELVEEGLSIKTIKGLQHLNLKGCNKITDVSLKYGLMFLELRKLLLSNCQQISLMGMAALVKNCPSIEELDISDCYNINDKAIETITLNLKRLKVFNISGCTQLTDHSLDSVVTNCKTLQLLSIYRCRCICTDIESRLSSLSSLRTINMDRSGNIDNADIFRFKKRMDY